MNTTEGSNFMSMTPAQLAGLMYPNNKKYQLFVEKFCNFIDFISSRCKESPEPVIQAQSERINNLKGLVCIAAPAAEQYLRNLVCTPSGDEKKPLWDNKLRELDEKRVELFVIEFMEDAIAKHKKQLLSQDPGLITDIPIELEGNAVFESMPADMREKLIAYLNCFCDILIEEEQQHE